MQPNPAKSATDGFMLNVAGVSGWRAGGDAAGFYSTANVLPVSLSPALRPTLRASRSAWPCAWQLLALPA